MKKIWRSCIGFALSCSFLATTVSTQEPTKPITPSNQLEKGKNSFYRTGKELVHTLWAHITKHQWHSDMDGYKIQHQEFSFLRIRRCDDVSKYT